MFTSIKPGDKLYTKILRQIQDRIMQGELKPGDKLPPERQMAESFGCSRPALKQALSILEAMEILECRQGDGNYILPFQNKIFNPIILNFYAQEGNIEDILEVRYLLEVQVVKLLALKSNASSLKPLEDILEQMKGVKPGNDSIEKRVSLNNAFHSALIHLNHNPILTAFYDSMLELVGLQIMNTDGTDFYSTHKKILDGIKSGNPSKAAEAMTQHFTAKFPNYEYYITI